jgi:dephospho-CoA kinase
LAAIVKHFGTEVINADGSLNRKALANRVFENRHELTALNAIVHPLVRELSTSLLEQFASDAIVIYNVPLLVEAAVDHDFDLIVTVEAPEDEQLRRLVELRGMAPAEAKARIMAQAKPVERAARADRILSSNQDVHSLLRDADHVWQDVIRLAAKKAEK